MGAFEAADLLFETGSFGRALMVYLDAVERYPKDHRRSWAELQIARAYQRLGRKQEAKDAYQALAKEGGESLLNLVATEYGKTVKAK
jgi:TolA-binding protein